jgi:acetamidase/formamidase
MDASSGNITSREDLPSKVAHWPWTNPCVGPIFVEGAERGDILCVEILDIQPQVDWAASWLRENVGALVGSVWNPTISPPLDEDVWIYKLEDGKVIFQANHSDLKVTMPYEPSLGTIGVAPLIEAIHTLSPDAHGGNMDCIETGIGATVYFPVHVDGALLSFGDAHAIQGDGELSAVAVEMRSISTVRVDVLKGKSIRWPRIENDDYIMVVGSTRPLEGAYRIAFKELVLWLAEDYQLALTDAYKLVAHLGKARVGNVVDPHFSLVAKFPKAFLPEIE